MRILVTGAGGYVGLHVVRELVEHGDEVTAVVRSAARLGPIAQAPRVTIVEGDLRDDTLVAAALPGHDACVHAALAWGEPGSELEARDVALTARIFDAAGAAGVSRGLYLSSAAVHRPFRPEMDEEDALETADLYGATKAAGELFLRAACARHAMTGVVVRPGPVVGAPAHPAASFRSPEPLVTIVRAAATGSVIDVVSGEGRQLTGVSALARAIRLLLREPDPPPTCICVDRDVLTWERVAHVAVECLGSASVVRVLPRPTSDPIPRFRTDRLESLLGGPTSAEPDLRAHVHHLARTLPPDATGRG